MTPYQLNTTPTIELLKILKAKAICRHSYAVADKIFKHLENILDNDLLKDLKLAIWHVQNNGDASDYSIFYDEIDALIAQQEKYNRDTKRHLTKLYLNHKS